MFVCVLPDQGPQNGATTPPVAVRLTGVTIFGAGMSDGTTSGTRRRREPTTIFFASPSTTCAQLV